jgi:mannose-6-phosphate isomerase-like protein (cupin superfamily)
VVLDGEATFYDKAGNTKVLGKGEGIMLPEHWYYWFQSTGDKPLALLRFTSYKSNRPQVKRVDAQGRTREEDEVGYAYVDGEPIREQFWELS